MRAFLGELVRAAALTILPLLLFATALVAVLGAQERAGVLGQLDRRAASGAADLDRIFDRQIVQLSTLAGSPALESGDLSSFYTEAERALAAQSDWFTIVLSDPQSGRQLLNLLRAGGTALPRVPDLSSHERAVRTGKPVVVSDPNARGPVSGRPVLGVRVPVIREGRVIYVLSAALERETVAQALQRLDLPPGWIGRIADARGVIIAHTRRSDLVGQPVAPALMERIAAGQSGRMIADDRDGRLSHIALGRAPLSGWTVGLSVWIGDITALWLNKLWVVGLAGLVSILTALGAMALQIRRRRAAERELEARVRERTAALRESEARFRNLADSAPVMVWVTEPSGFCSYLSASWYEFTGQTPETGLGNGWLDAIHPDDRRAVWDGFTRAAASREPFRVEYHLRRADGHWRWAMDTAAPRIGEDGAFLGYVGSVVDITERKQDEERLRLLAAEVDHRARNMLAVVKAVVQLTRADSIAAFKRAIEGRIGALSRVHTLLSQGRWEGADLKRVIEEELAPWRRSEGGRVHAEGPAVALAPAAAQSIAMVVHELATNAAKHGALSVPEGRLAVEWHMDPDFGLVLIWSESCGPLIAPPKSTGLGASVIERTVHDQLGGAVRIDWLATGLECRISVPKEKLLGLQPAA